MSCSYKSEGLYNATSESRLQVVEITWNNIAMIGGVSYTFGDGNSALSPCVRDKLPQCLGYDFSCHGTAEERPARREVTIEVGRRKLLNINVQNNVIWYSRSRESEDWSLRSY